MAAVTSCHKPQRRSLGSSWQSKQLLRPMMGVFNLVIFKQDLPQNTLRSIVPELATGWAWNEECTELTFPMRQGIKWHDSKRFTAADVKCTIETFEPPRYLTSLTGTLELGFS
jgi:ABC-type transport system substrate-binding protein